MHTASHTCIHSHTHTQAQPHTHTLTPTSAHTLIEHYFICFRSAVSLVWQFQKSHNWFTRTLLSIFQYAQHSLPARFCSRPVERSLLISQVFIDWRLRLGLELFSGHTGVLVIITLWAFSRNLLLLVSSLYGPQQSSDFTPVYERKHSDHNGKEDNEEWEAHSYTCGGTGMQTGISAVLLEPGSVQFHDLE